VALRGENIQEEESLKGAKLGPAEILAL